MSTVAKIERRLTRLDAEQLDAVSNFIDLLLCEDEPDEPDQDTGQDQGKLAGGGYVEYKVIRGYGPYAYWRFRSGGRLRSKYLGKVDQNAPTC